ncbi:hypothetical protein Q427_30805 [Halomonas sp. BC04]|nr:hypothetical protein Q427_30805 [Halomonas sp. BC04]
MEETTPYGVVKGKGRQRVDDPMAAGKAPVAGLDADDGGNHVRRYAILRFGALKGVMMRLDKGHATLDPLRLQEDLPILVPAQSPFRGAFHGVQHALLELGAAQGRLQPLTLNTAIDQGIDKLSRSLVLRRIEVCGACPGRQHQQGQYGNAGTAGSFPLTHWHHSLATPAGACRSDMTIARRR